MFPGNKVKGMLCDLIKLLLIIPCLLQAQTNWIKCRQNPVMGDFLFNGAPAVKPFVFEDRGLFRMMYTTWDMNWKRSINEALSFDGVRWYQLSGQPLLMAGASGSFDESGLSKPCVIKDKNGYKMYYYTEDRYPHLIGLATSEDGLRWTKYPDNPILVQGRDGAWDEAGVWAPIVICHDSVTYRMYYQGSDGEYSSIGYATSEDGIHWKKYHYNPILRHGGSDEFDELTCGEPNVVCAAGRFHMFYASADIATRNRIGYAYSEDGIEWTKYDGNPVLDACPSLWENQCVAAPTVIYKDSMFHMWYSGWSAGQATNIGYAVSVLDTAIIGNIIPDGFSLDQNYPNPFNPVTKITFNVPKASDVVLRIYDVLGREITTLVNEKKEPGKYTLPWNADGLGSGMYFYRMKAGDFIKTKKMVLLK